MHYLFVMLSLAAMECPPRGERPIDCGTISLCPRIDCSGTDQFGLRGRQLARERKGLRQRRPDTGMAFRA